MPPDKNTPALPLLLRAWRAVTEPTPAVAPRDRGRARFIAQVLASLFPLYLVASVFSIFARVEPLGPAESAVGGAAVAGAIAAYVFARRGLVTLGAVMLALVGTAGGLAASLVESEPSRAVPSILFTLTGIAYAAFLFRPRVAAALGALAIAATLALPAAHPTLAPRDVVVPTALIFFVSALTVVGAMRRDAQLRRARRARDRLRHTEARLRATLDSSLDAVVTLDGARRVLDWNRQAEASLGWTRGEALGRDFLELVFSAAERERVGTLLAADEGASPGARRAECTAVDRAGREFPAEVCVAPMRLGAGAGSCVFLRDVTDRRRMEAELVQSDRLVTLGRLAAGVAHEVNNPLTYVLTNLQLVEEQLRGAGPVDGERLRPALDDVLHGATRVQRIVRDLGSFARAGEEHCGPVDVRRALENALQFASNEIRHRAKLTRDFAPVPLVNADEGRLAQVFLNLLVNAAQALPHGEPDRHEIHVSTRVDAEGRVLVRVRDTGPGIAPDVRAQLFHPFFTTKAPGEGTGLGLCVSRNIVRAAGGDIEIESGPDAGAMFVVWLPAAPDVVAAPAAGSLPPAPRAPAGALRILVVDDDTAVAHAISRALATHEVSLAANGAEALELAASTAFDLVLCDVVMPGMTGHEVRARLIASGAVARERIVLMTGSAVAARGHADGARVLEKPVDLRGLKAVVAEFAPRSVDRATAA